MLSTATSFAGEGPTSNRPAPHASVMAREVLNWVRPIPGGTYVDATVGPGGHAEIMLEHSAPGGRVLGIDRDPSALAWAAKRLARFGDRFTPIHGDYRRILNLVQAAGVFAVDGIVADLGLSSLQLDDPARGFSFRADGPLDMRMDPTSGGPTAADLLRTLSETEIRSVLREFGEERLAPAIARAIVKSRAKGPLTRTRELAEIVAGVAGRTRRPARIHPATRTFQALRIVVNGEIEGLESFVADAFSLVRRGGRVCVVSFHSLEDRAVKHALRALAERCICPPRLPVCGCGRENLVRLLTPGAVLPGRDEIEANPRARSAKLRAAERI